MPNLLSSTPMNWWATDNSPGQLLCHTEFAGNNLPYQVIIDQADPLIWISAGIVSWAATGQAAPRITLAPRPDWSEYYYWIGSVIRFHADNRNVLYRLKKWGGKVTPQIDGAYDLGHYVAEWPD